MMIETEPRDPDARARLLQFIALETAKFRGQDTAPPAERGQGWYAGVPLHWMLDWPVAPTIQSAQGSEVTDTQGRVFNDFCLGDSAALFGHSPPEVVAAVQQQLQHGFNTLLVDERARRVGGLLAERFRLPFWQMTLSASDANRFAVRLARAITGRDLVLVFEGCYHGAVEDAMVTAQNGRVVARPGLLGQVGDLRNRARVIPFNDLKVLRRALRDKKVACVLAEPVMTNCGMIEPLPGFWDAVREETLNTVTPLILDETHTVSSGPGGYSARFTWDPDFKVIGKPLAGGLPAAVWGFSAPIAECFREALATKPSGHSGIGTTLSANALGMAAMEAVLTHYMIPDVFNPMIQKAEMLADKIRAVFAARALDWQVIQTGARLEMVMSPRRPLNADDVIATRQELLEQAIHIGLANRGSLLTPFHNMMLISPATRLDQIDQLVAGLDEVLGLLTQRG